MRAKVRAAFASCNRQLRLGFQEKDWQIAAAAEFMLGRDVCLITGTGTGKSLCYLLCNMTNVSDIIIVFSPLLSLIADQVKSAMILDIKACAISWESMKANTQLIHEVTQGDYQLILM